MKANVTARTIATRLEVTTRAIQKRAKAMGIPKKNGKYLFTQAEAVKLIGEMSNNSDRPETEQMITESFTVEQYDALDKVISNYKAKMIEIKGLVSQLEHTEIQINYLRKSLDARDRQMEKLIDSFQTTIKNMSERNYIEAKEKGINTD